MGKMQVLKDNKQARHFRGQLRETEQVQTEHCVSSYLGHEDQSSISEMKEDGCWGCHVFFKKLFCASQEAPSIFFMSLLWEGFLKCNEKNAPYKWRGALGNESTFIALTVRQTGRTQRPLEKTLPGEVPTHSVWHDNLLFSLLFSTEKVLSAWYIQYILQVPKCWPLTRPCTMPNSIQLVSNISCLNRSVVRYFPDRDANLSINQEWYGIKLSSTGTI